MKIIFLALLFAATLPAVAANYEDELTPKEAKEAARQSQLVADAFGLPAATESASGLGIYRGSDAKGGVCYVSVKVAPQDYELGLLTCEPDTSGTFRCTADTKLEYIRTEKRGSDSTVEWGSSARKQRVFGNNTILWNKYKNVQHTPIFKKYQDGREKTVRIHAEEDGTISLSTHFHYKEGESGLFASAVGTDDWDKACSKMRPVPYEKADMNFDTFGLVPRGKLRKELYDTWKVSDPARAANYPYTSDEPEHKGNTSAR